MLFITFMVSFNIAQCPSPTYTPCNKLCVQFQGKLIFSFNLKPNQLLSPVEIIHDIISTHIEGVPLNENILHLYQDNKLLYVHNLFKFTEAQSAVVYVDLRGELLACKRFVIDGDFFPWHDKLSSFCELSCQLDSWIFLKDLILILF